MGPVAIEDEPTAELPVIAGPDAARHGETTAELPLVEVPATEEPDADEPAGRDKPGDGRPGGEAGDDEAGDEADPAGDRPEPPAKPVRMIVIGDKDGITGTVARALPSVPAAVPNKRVGRLVFGDGIVGGATAGDADTDEVTPTLTVTDPTDTEQAAPRTVVIGDLDEPDADDIDPRIKARRRMVLRAAGLRRLKWVLVPLVVIGLLLGTNLMLRSPLFDVRDVSITGTSYIDQADLDAIRNELVGKPLVSIDLSSVRRTVEGIVWVRAVDVSRDWPHTIHIDILERRPIAYYAGDDGLIHLVDIDGRVVANLEGMPIDFVEVAGVGNSAAPGEDAPPELLPAIRVANDLPEGLRADVKTVRLVKEGVILDLKAGGGILLGDTTDLRDKLVAALAVRGQCPPGSYTTLDVRVPSRPAVSPKTGCGGSLNGTKP